jgi:hypothetical protein
MNRTAEVDLQPETVQTCRLWPSWRTALFAWS